MGSCGTNYTELLQVLMSLKKRSIRFHQRLVLTLEEKRIDLIQRQRCGDHEKQNILEVSFFFRNSYSVIKKIYNLIT